MQASQTTRIWDRTASRLALAAGVAGVALLASSAGAQMLGDAHDDFSDVQGQNNWWYGYFDGSSDTPWALDDFELLPIFNGLYWTRPEGVDGYWTRITRDGGHPNGIVTCGCRVPELNWAVRRWVSPGQYLVQISGRLWDAAPQEGGNGVIGHIQVNGQEIWTGTIDNGNQHGLEFALQQCVAPDDIVDFAIDPRDGDDLGDDTGFQVQIQSVIQTQPQDTFTCEGGTVELYLETLPGDYHYQWRFNTVPIQHDANMDHFRIVNVTPDKVGSYDCIVSNGCGSMLSDAAQVSICRTDVDCDGVIDSNDFFQYVTVFFGGSMEADYNNDGMVNSQDFFDFLGSYFTGC